MLEDSVLPSRATYLQHQTNKQKMPASGSVALPAVMRTGGGQGNHGGRSFCEATFDLDFLVP